MKTKGWTVGLMVLCTVILSIAQVFWKLGADKLQFDFFSLITNYNLILGFFLYGISGIMFIIALKGGELTVIHPMISMSLIFVAIITPYFIPVDTMSGLKWIGIIIIISGIGLITYSNWRSEND